MSGSQSRTRFRPFMHDSGSSPFIPDSGSRPFIPTTFIPVPGGFRRFIPAPGSDYPVIPHTGSNPFIPLPRPDQEVYTQYCEELKNSGGFDVYACPNMSIPLPCKPTSIENIAGGSYESIVPSAILAIYHYNHRQNPKRYFGFSKLVHATSSRVAGQIFYITFEATELGRIRGRPAVETFQAEVFRCFTRRLEVAFCRLKDENKKPLMSGSPPTTADWRGSHLEQRNHGPYSVASLDDVDVKTVATVAMFLHSRTAIGYMFSKLVSAFSTNTDGARIFNITFEAVGRREGDLNVVKTFEAVVWQLYPSFNLEVEYCRLKNEQEEVASGANAQISTYSWVPGSDAQISTYSTWNS